LGRELFGAARGDQSVTGCQPSTAPAGNIHSGITVHFHVRGGTGGAASGAADDEIIGVRVQLVDAQGQLVQRDVDRARDVAGVEFIRIAHIQDVCVVGYLVYGEGFKVAHGAYGKPEKCLAASKSRTILTVGVYS